MKFEYAFAWLSLQYAMDCGNSGRVGDNIMFWVKNEHFLDMFKIEDIDKLIGILSREKKHEAVAHLMDYKARKYGFRQNGENDLL